MNVKKNESYKPANSIKKYMHPRNPYKTPPSFKKLAISYPEFRKHCTNDVSNKVHLDFKNPEALSSLTKCLLMQDFDLKVNIPSDRLVPTLPLRLNYLLWIEDLLTLVFKKPYKSLSSYTIIGLDIGTGATCIYPLLGAKKFGWNFLATESDEYSYAFAQENISNNVLTDKIFLAKMSEFFDVLNDEDAAIFLKNIRQTTSKSDKSSNGKDKLDKIAGKDEYEGNHANNYLVDFTICNPPFFSSEEDMDTKNKSKKETRSEPSSTPTGSNHEKIVDGGEVSFISKMIDMSTKYKGTIRIFSSMIGNQKNVKVIKKKLQNVNPAHLVVTEFCQGRTMRWGIAWTFDSSITLEKILSKKQMCNSKPLTLLVPRTLMNEYSVQATWKKVEAWLKILKLKPHIVKKNNFFVSVIIKAYKETWLHQRKKKREQKKGSSEGKRKFVSTNIEMEDSVPKKIKTFCDSILSPHSCESQNCKNSGESLQGTKFDSPDSPLKLSEEDVKEDLESSLNLNHKEGKKNEPCVESSSVSDGIQDSAILNNLLVNNDNGVPKAKDALECLLRCSINIKQTNALVSIEMSLLGGTKGKDAMNQLLQFMRNKLKNGE